MAACDKVGRLAAHELLEAPSEHDRKIVLDQPAELGGAGELAVGGRVVGLDAVEQLHETWLSRAGRALDVDQPRAVPRQEVLILDSRDALAGTRSSRTARHRCR